MNSIKIPQFYGIQQQQDGSLLDIQTAENAVNMETEDGNLTVAEAFRTVVPSKAQEEGEEYIALFAFERETPSPCDVLIACSNKRILWFSNAVNENGERVMADEWQELIPSGTDGYDPANESSAFDAQLCRIWNEDYVLIATGGTQIIKAPINDLAVGNGTWEWFGSDVYWLDTPATIASVDTTDITHAVITMADDDFFIDATTQTYGFNNYTRAVVFGIYIMDGDSVKYLLFPDKFEDVTANTITLDLTGCEVTTDNTIQLRGGVSDKHVRSLELYLDRLWSAGDPEHQSRLYWSCPAGEGRTIEEWTSDDYDPDASGGHVDVGVADGDRIVALKAMNDCLLIFKVNSVWRLYGDRPSTYTLERLSEEVGAYDDGEIVTRYGTPYWLTKNGIFYCDGTNAISADNDIDYLKDIFWEVEGKQRRSATCVPALRKMVFELSSNVLGRFILTRDLVTGAYLTFNGVEVKDVATASDRCLFLASDGAVLERDENSEVITDYHTGEPLDAVWTSQRMELGGLTGTKQINVLWFRARGGRIRITVRTDISERSFDVVPDEKQTDVIRLPIMMNEARTLQLEFRNVQGSRWSIEGGITIGYTAKYEM